VHHPETEFADGTLFSIKSMEKVCIAILRAWALLNTNPEAINRQLAVVLEIFRLQKYNGISYECEDDEEEEEDNVSLKRNQRSTKKKKHASMKEEWVNVKQSIKEAQILPLELIALRMMKKSENKDAIPEPMIPFLRDAEGLRKKKRMELDWYAHDKWFMSHMVEYDMGPDNKKVMRTRGYKDWKISDTASADSSALSCEIEEEGEEERNNDVSNDRWDNVCRKQYHHHQQVAAEVVAVKRKLTSEERKVKAKAGPFHPMVVDAANRAIQEAFQYDDSNF
jgi:hypothetical protein